MKQRALSLRAVYATECDKTLVTNTGFCKKNNNKHDFFQPILNVINYKYVNSIKAYVKDFNHIGNIVRINS